MAELCIGAALAFGVPFAEAVAAALFVGFAIVLSVAYARGADGVCSCFGEDDGATIGPAAIARAVALGAAAAFVAAGPEPAGYQPFLRLAFSLVLATAVVLGLEIRISLRSSRVM
jgi:hypothetical protein